MRTLILLVALAGICASAAYHFRHRAAPVSQLANVTLPEVARATPVRSLEERAAAAQGTVYPERQPEPPASPAAHERPVELRCDGRERCPQMHSCEEATWFVRNCPNTKMDGDNDGVPCESQWCPGG